MPTRATNPPDPTTPCPEPLARKRPPPKRRDPTAPAPLETPDLFARRVLNGKGKSTAKGKGKDNAEGMLRPKSPGPAAASRVVLQKAPRNGKKTGERPQSAASSRSSQSISSVRRSPRNRQGGAQKQSQAGPSRPGRAAILPTAAAKGKGKGKAPTQLISSPSPRRPLPRSRLAVQTRSFNCLAARAPPKSPSEVDSSDEEDATVGRRAGKIGGGSRIVDPFAPEKEDGGGDEDRDGTQTRGGDGDETPDESDSDAGAGGEEIASGSEVDESGRGASSKGGGRGSEETDNEQSDTEQDTSDEDEETTEENSDIVTPRKKSKKSRNSGEVVVSYHNTPFTRRTVKGKQTKTVSFADSRTKSVESHDTIYYKGKVASAKDDYKREILVVLGYKEASSVWRRMDRAYIIMRNKGLLNTGDDRCGFCKIAGTRRQRMISPTGIAWHYPIFPCFVAYIDGTEILGKCAASTFNQKSSGDPKIAEEDSVASHRDDDAGPGVFDDQHDHEDGRVEHNSRRGRGAQQSDDHHSDGDSVASLVSQGGMGDGLPDDTISLRSLRGAIQPIQPTRPIQACSPRSASHRSNDMQSSTPRLFQPAARQEDHRPHPPPVPPQHRQGSTITSYKSLGPSRRLKGSHRMNLVRVAIAEAQRLEELWESRASIVGKGGLELKLLGREIDDLGSDVRSDLGDESGGLGISTMANKYWRRCEQILQQWAVIEGDVGKKGSKNGNSKEDAAYMATKAMMEVVHFLHQILDKLVKSEAV